MPRCHAAILAALLLLGLTLHANLPDAAYRTPSSWSRHTKDIACELLETGSFPRMVETYRGGDRLTSMYDYMGWRVERCVEELDVVIATTNAADTSCFLHDANKNVMQRTDADGDLLGKNVYAPFGGNTGEVSADIGFSSGVFDSSTNFNYNSYLYHTPRIGRWTKRDLIGERGGININIFVSKQPEQYWDNNGISWMKCIPIASTISSLINTPHGIQLFDCKAPRMPRPPSCNDNDILDCMNSINIQLMRYISHYVGVTKWSDGMKALLGGIGGRIMRKIAVKEGGRVLLGTSITGGVLFEDGLVYLTITLHKQFRMEDAATEAKGVFCKCN